MELEQNTRNRANEQISFSRKVREIVTSFWGKLTGGTLQLSLFFLHYFLKLFSICQLQLALTQVQNCSVFRIQETQ